MLHVMSARCVACDLHMTVPWPLECNVGIGLRCSEEIVQNLKLRISIRLLLSMIKTENIVPFIPIMMIVS